MKRTFADRVSEIFPIFGGILRVLIILHYVFVLYFCILIGYSGTYLYYRLNLKPGEKVSKAKVFVVGTILQTALFIFIPLFREGAYILFYVLPAQWFFGVEHITSYDTFMTNFFN